MPHLGTSDEYPQYMVLGRNKKNNNTFRSQKKKKCLIWSYFKVIMFKCILLLIDLDAFDVWLTVYLYVDEVTLSN